MAMIPETTAMFFSVSVDTFAALATCGDAVGDTEASLALASSEVRPCMITTWKHNSRNWNCT